MGRSKFGNAERKGWNEDICQLNVLSGLEGSKEKADTPRSNCSDWHVRSRYQFLASADKPLVLANPQRRWDDDQTVVSVTMIGQNRQSSSPTLKRPGTGAS